MGRPSNTPHPTPKTVGATPQPAPARTGGCESFRLLVSQYDWDVNIALAVMKAESGCRPNADNTGLNRDGTNDKGLFQINNIHVNSGLITDAGRLDPEQNVKAAYAIYRGSGWRAWAAYNSGSYLKYM